jgi:protein phosphatase methylesterase 1
MSELQKKWAKAKMNSVATGIIREADEDGETGYVPELPEFMDDDSSSASSASSTGTIVPSPSRNLFARPQG